MTNQNSRKRLNELFSNKAERLNEKIYDFFSEPSYFTALQDNRPFILVGGRGTGKTTVLRGLSYVGQYALHKKDINIFDSDTSFVGIYHRVDTNHMTAFSGGGVKDEDWIKIFAHYFNLIICREILLFVDWHKRLQKEDESLTKKECELICKSLIIRESVDDFQDLLKAIDSTLYEFQGIINNISGEKKPDISLAGAPVQLVTSLILKLSQFKNKMFFIMIDEYENYLDYQQQVVNSLIKHTPQGYTFKIAVREQGWRVKYTMNKNEMLNDPADYVIINIEQKLTEGSEFSNFAKSVCQQRLKQLLADQTIDFDLSKKLNTLTAEEEAKLLKIEDNEYFKEFKKISHKLKGKLNCLPELYKYFFVYWSKVQQEPLEKEIEDYVKNSSKWDERYENYKFDLLFKIRKGRGKAGIQKYYSGWETFTKLASGNIRYLMELVFRTYEKHLEDHCIDDNVSLKVQTEAAKKVGLKNLMELEGLWEKGAQITRLLQGLGRFFQLLAQDDKSKHAPEITQFVLRTVSAETQELLDAAVMNLALKKIPANKLDKEEARSWQYTLHPIFAPYFLYSYRKKRKMDISEDDFRSLISEPRNTIKNLLKNKNIRMIEIPELLLQLEFGDDE